MEARQAVTYSGQGFSPKGDKDRFVLPPQFRKAVRDSSGDRILCLTRHDRWKCLIGFGLSRRDEFEDQLDREEMVAAQTGREFDRDVRAQQLYGFAEVSFDDSGRFVMPGHLKQIAAIDEAAFFQAAGRFFMLWSPDELALMGAGWESAQAACASFMAAQQKGRK